MISKKNILEVSFLGKWLARCLHRSEEAYRTARHATVSCVAEAFEFTQLKTEPSDMELMRPWSIARRYDDDEDERTSFLALFDHMILDKTQPATSEPIAVADENQTRGDGVPAAPEAVPDAMLIENKSIDLSPLAIAFSWMGKTPVPLEPFSQYLVQQHLKPAGIRTADLIIRPTVKGKEKTYRVLLLLESTNYREKDKPSCICCRFSKLIHKISCFNSGDPTMTVVVCFLGIIQVILKDTDVFLETSFKYLAELVGPI